MTRGWVVSWVRCPDCQTVYARRPNHCKWCGFIPTLNKPWETPDQGESWGEETER